MVEDSFFSLVKKFNALMKSAIEGPNCIDPSICRGDCCSIQIDMPKKLSKEFIRMGFGTKSDFIRSDVFSFKLRFDEKTGKCFLFSKDINGCSVHNTGIKPPQCWIYPTKFSNKNENISCKKAPGWRIINFEKTKEAKKILDEYVAICQSEATEELEITDTRLGVGDSEKVHRKYKELFHEIQQLPPKEFAGLKDTWTIMKVLRAEGMSLQLKKFCMKFNSECKLLPDDFFICENICPQVAKAIISHYQNYLYWYIKANGPDNDGEYSLYNLGEFLKDYKPSNIE